MRPGKKVLIYSDLEATGSVYKFAFHVSGFAAEAVSNLRRFSELLAEHQPVVVLLLYHGPITPMIELLTELDRVREDVKVIILKHEPASEQHWVSDCLCMDRDMPMCDLISRMKMLACRKRGPRKKTSKLSTFEISNCA